MVEFLSTLEYLTNRTNEATMKKILATRLRAARQAIAPEITQRDVAKRLNLSPSAINLWEAGKTEPSASDIAELSRWYQVSTDWLLGVDSVKTTTAKSSAAINVVPVVAPSALARWHWDAVMELLQTSVAYPPQTAAAMLVSSDALTNSCPTGCYAVISKGHTAEPGHIVLAMIGKAGEPVLRKYVREGGTDLLVADDVRFPTFRMDDGVQIIGRVTEITIRKSLI
jgi:SOS-response transcriptional repressor LexA